MSQQYAEMSIHISQTVNEPCLQLGGAYTRDPSRLVRREAGAPLYFLIWPLGRDPECASW